jgi:hypothetical protein
MKLSPSGGAMLNFEELDVDGTFNGTPTIHRAKVPGGWLVVMTGHYTGICFIPDPKHKWDGRSLPLE